RVVATAGCCELSDGRWAGNSEFVPHASRAIAAATEMQYRRIAMKSNITRTSRPTVSFVTGFAGVHPGGFILERLDLCEISYGRDESKVFGASRAAAPEFTAAPTTRSR